MKFKKKKKSPQKTIVLCKAEKQGEKDSRNWKYYMALNAVILH